MLSSTAFGQTTKARAEVDYAARLKEVQANPKQLEEAMKTGRRVAGFCANCHGEGGNSTNPDIPNLAGQNPGYLLDQVRQFAEGRRKNEFMEGMIRALKPEETIGMVVFFGSQAVLPHRSGANPAQVAKGRELFSKNCFRCHGENGLGSERFARIAGQQSGYLAKTIKRYRAGSVQRSDPLMAAATSLLSDADVEALAAYVSGME
ncbi:c-type cytochrome [Curvibacter sp. APW13]|uniref:c-type cytochrome n=1 Tax=Curvibacter sp. APW13 TaxID=3077236 RepID=UPI0028E01161|nr:c-type cytochrome [Curvibacter sp. APW13]MDT8990498.1 c-type cytochrome [Curvibacter sp. APW13]